MKRDLHQKKGMSCSFNFRKGEGKRKTSSPGRLPGKRNCSLDPALKKRKKIVQRNRPTIKKASAISEEEPPGPLQSKKKKNNTEERKRKKRARRIADAAPKKRGWATKMNNWKRAFSCGKKKRKHFAVVSTEKELVQLKLTT